MIKDEDLDIEKGGGEWKFVQADSESVNQRARERERGREREQLLISLWPLICSFESCFFVFLCFSFYFSKSVLRVVS